MLYHSILIEPRSCPRCRIHRTGRFWQSRGYFCFNCRLQWHAPAAAAPSVAGRH